MPNFQNLQKILDMDFKEMRALKTNNGGMRATDEAIYFFVNNLMEFYSQFDRSPSNVELKEYVNYMEKITEKINESEYEYYLEKYSIEYPDSSQEMASSTKLNNFKDIPVRMQYWAASEEFGGAIRNEKKHAAVVKYLNKWAQFKIKNPMIFFQPEKDDSNYKGSSFTNERN